jgi:hypothetical protein
MTNLQNFITEKIKELNKYVLRANTETGEWTFDSKIWNAISQSLTECSIATADAIRGKKKEEVEYGLDNYEHSEADQIFGFNSAIEDSKSKEKKWFNK